MNLNKQESNIVGKIICEICQKPIVIMEDKTDEDYCTCYLYNLMLLSNYIRLFTFTVN